jgi:O-antigen ligase
MTATQPAGQAAARSAAAAAPGRASPQEEAPRARWWLTVVVLAMLVSSDFKPRTRALSDSIGGRPDPTVLVEIATYGLVSLLLLTILLRIPARRTAATPLLFVTLLYCGYMAASAVWAVYPTIAAVRGWQFLVSAALATAIARSARRVDLHHLAHWYCALVAAAVVSGLVFVFPRYGLQEGRFTWLYVHPVVSGAYCGLALVLLAWLIWLNRSRSALITWPAWTYPVMVVLATGGLIGTQTRGAIGACLLGLLVLAFLAARGRRLDMAAVAGLGLLTFAVLFLRPVLEFLSRGQPDEQLSTFNGRVQLWTEAWRLLGESPVIGYGLTASRGLFVEATGLGGAHNAFVNVLTDGGAVGAVLWCAVLAGAAGMIVRLLRLPVWRDAVALAAVLAYLFVGGLTYEGLGYVGLMPATMLFVMVGWVAVLARGAASGRRSTPAVPAPAAVAP